jgi:hypothetical protein
MFCVSVSYVEKTCKTVYTLLWGYVGLVWYGGVTFYPASGYRHRESGSFTNTGSNGYAWSCAVTGANGCFLDFSSTYVGPTGNSLRAYGFPVRCVQNLLFILKIKSLIRVEDSLTVKKAVTFYPALGYRLNTSGEFLNSGSYGRAWSCAVTGANGYFLLFNSTNVNPTSNNNRAYGFPVRCVQYLRSDLCVSLKGSFLL